jgi:hypothetical protein
MHHTYRMTGMLLGLMALTVSACGKNDQQRADSAAAASGSGMMAAPADSSAMGGMGGMAKSGTDSMGAMAGMPGMAGMSPEMTAHIATMKGADGAKMKTMLPEHRKMVANMLATMNDQMKQMKMSATPAWTALTDSIRNDLKIMPDQSALALASMMPAHEMRVSSLAAMHDGMMNGMK